MINQHITQHPSQSKEKSKIINKQKEKQQQKMSIFQKDEFFLIIVINLILATVQLSVFNIAFLVTFVTSCLKFYKTYLMEKCVDEIQIACLEIGNERRLVFVRLLSKFINGVLTEKDLKKNVFLSIITIGGYVIVRFAPFNWILLVIINFQYLACLKRRWQKSKEFFQKRQILENLMINSKEKCPKSLISTKSTNSSQYHPLPQFFYQNLNLIGKQFGELKMQKSLESNCSSNVVANQTIEMSMIEEEEESEKLEFDDDLPEHSNEKIEIVMEKKSIE